MQTSFFLAQTRSTQLKSCANKTTHGLKGSKQAHSFNCDSALRAKPCRLLIASSIGREHERVTVGTVVQIQNSIPLGRNGAQIPTGSKNTDDFARCQESPGLVRVALAGGPAAETQEAAIRRPVHVVNLVRLISNAQTPLVNRRLVGVQIERSSGDFVVTRPPRNLFAVWAQTGPAAR